MGLAQRIDRLHHGMNRFAVAGTGQAGVHANAGVQGPPGEPDGVDRIGVRFREVEGPQDIVGIQRTAMDFDVVDIAREALTDGTRRARRTDGQLTVGRGIRKRGGQRRGAGRIQAIHHTFTIDVERHGEGGVVKGCRQVCPFAHGYIE